MKGDCLFGVFEGTFHGVETLSKALTQLCKPYTRENMVDPVSLYSSENIFDGHTIQSWLIYGGGGEGLVGLSTRWNFASQNHSITTGQSHN